MIKEYNGLTGEELIGMLPQEQILHSLNVEMLVGKLVNWLPNQNREESVSQYACFSKAAYYHDIGKVYVPIGILQKAGGLTAEEYRVIQKHTEAAQELFAFFGEEVLRGLPNEMLPLIRDAAVYHHEWWNGKGYPFGLSGYHIPYIARVCAVCDAYDAMVSKRPYRKANSHEDACQELNRASGTQFEPELIHIFLEHEKEIFHNFRKLECEIGENGIVGNSNKSADHKFEREEALAARRLCRGYYTLDRSFS